jgi:hypothetical protein
MTGTCSGTHIVNQGTELSNAVSGALFPQNSVIPSGRPMGEVDENGNGLNRIEARRGDSQEAVSASLRNYGPDLSDRSGKRMVSHFWGVWRPSGPR